MITLKDNQPQIEEILAEPAPVPPAPAPSAAEAAQGVLALHGDETLERPDVVQARVYRLRSGFVRHNVYITLGWIEQAGRRRPIEIFFNSKDLTRSPEYAILTRLISALFRMSADPAVILEELRGIHDPAGGHYKNGRYMHSFYAEVADVIERFFIDVGILAPAAAPPVSPAEEGDNDSGWPGLGATVSLEESSVFPPAIAPNTHFKICPECNQRALKLENGCDVCVACGYSKCDK
jgi:ribonucleoside-diphosphate reductase alpha chain